MNPQQPARLGLILLVVIATTAVVVAMRYHTQILRLIEVQIETDAQLVQLQQQIDTKNQTRTQPIPEPLPPRRDVEATGESDADVELTRRQQRIDELSAALEEKERLLQSLRMQIAASTEPPAPRPSWEERLETMRVEEPERYQEMLARREEARQQANDAFAKKAAHFLNRDTSRMEPDDAESYELMLHLLHETWVLSDRIRDAESPDERQEMRRDLMDNVSTLRPLLREQRDREFQDLARQLGYDDAGAEQFVTYINEMLDITSLRPVWGGRGGGGGWGGGGGR